MSKYSGGLVLMVSLSSIVMAQIAAVAEPVQQVPHLKDLPRSATTVQEWIAQTPPPPQAPAQVTGVRLNPTTAGLEIILQTASPNPLNAVQSVDDKTLTIEIPNAILSLPNQQSFQSDSPTETVTARQLEGNRIQVRVVGKTALPNRR